MNMRFTSIVARGKTSVVNNLHRSLHPHYCALMEYRIKSDHNTLSITADTWSSRVHRRYLAINVHLIDKIWCLQSVIRDFKRCFTPHTREAWATLLSEVLCKWSIKTNILAITTNNGSKVIAWVNILNEKLHVEGWCRAQLPNGLYYQRCIA